jgi:signal transduction histidine kinase
MTIIGPGLEIGILYELRGIAPASTRRSCRRTAFGAALRSLDRHATESTALDIGGIGRAAAYYVVSEVLTNAVKYANATVVRVDLGLNDTTLRLPIDDDGDGGACPALGSGIIA